MDNLENTIPTSDTEMTDTAGKEKKQKKKGLINSDNAFLALAFVLPALIMYLLYVAMEIHPFGDGSVLVLDLNGQYVYFFEGLRNIVYEGGSFLYSFSRALGGEFMGIWAYYLASPFSFIVLLFKKTQILDALLCIFLLKCGACGFTFGYYLYKTSKIKNKVMIITFSAMYALSSYAIVQQHNTMWIDALIYLPLITLGIEQIIKYKKYKLFVITLALSILSNYYIGYMTCIFVAIYFFYYYIANTPNDAVNPLGEKNHFVKTLLRMALYSLIAVGIAMIIILPAYYSLSFGKDDFSNPSHSLSQNYDFLDIMTKLLPGSYDTVRPDGMPFIYTGILTLLLVPVYFISKKFTAIERISSAFVVIIFFLSFNASLVDLVWHGMQFPNWLNHRYSFMLCFFLLLLAYKGFESLDITPAKTVLAIGSFIGVLLFVVQKFDYENLPDLESIWFSLVCVVMYMLLLYTIIQTNGAGAINVILSSLICLELFCSGLLNMVSLGDDVIYSSRSSYLDYINKYQPIVDLVRENDTSFYRMEKVNHRKTNDAFSLWFRGLSNSTSTLNKSTIQFLKDMGYASRSHWSKYLGGTPITDSLLGIKYIISEYDISPLYSIAHKTEELYAYNNPYALSIAYGVSSEIEDYRMVLGMNEETGEDEYKKEDTFITPFERINSIVDLMLDDYDGVDVFVPIEQNEITTTNCDVSYIAGHVKYLPVDTSKVANIHYSFTSVTDKEVYFYLPSDYPRQVKLTLNGVSYDTFYGNETTRIVSLGRFPVGSTVNLTITIDQTDLYVWNRGTAFYYMDHDAFKDVMSKLSVSQFEISEYTEDHFTGTINIEKGHETILTTIPYDKGWNVYIDGEKVETYEALDALMAFDTTVGEHTLEMRYMPKEFVIGAACTAFFSVVFFALCAFDLYKNKKAAKVIAAENN